MHKSRRSKTLPVPFGTLNQETSLSLSSRESLHVLRGRKPLLESKNPRYRVRVHSTYRFKYCMDHIIKESKLDNPYADLWLIQMENQIQRIITLLKRNQKNLLEKLADLPFDELPLSKSKRRYTATLDFGDNIYANQALEIIGWYDKVMVLLDSCMLRNCIEPDERHTILNVADREIRKLFKYSIKRKDQLTKENRIDRSTFINSESPRVIKIKEQFGRIPPSIVEGIELPLIRQNDDIVMDDDELKAQAKFYGVYSDDLDLFDHLLETIETNSVPEERHAG